MVAILVTAEPVLAQTEEELPEGASSVNEIAQPGEPAHDDDMDVRSADPDPSPRPPAPLSPTPIDPDVIEQAGVGGPVAYGDVGVLEVGGFGSLLLGESITMRLRPFVSWFVLNGFALSLSNDVVVEKHDNEGFRVLATVVLEPSMHFPVDRRFLIAVGLGGGVIVGDDDVGAVVVPRVGTDILVGRSGVFHMSAVATLTTTKSGSQASPFPAEHLWGGLDIGYGVLF